MTSSLADLAPLGLLGTDEGWTIVAANPGIHDLTGRAHGDLIGRSMASLLTRAGRTIHQTVYAPRLLRDGEAQEVAFELDHVDGHRVPVLLSSRVVDGPGGLAHVTAVTPVPGRRREQRDLLTATRRAQAARRQAAMLHDVARDLAAAASHAAVADHVASHLDAFGHVGQLWLPTGEGAWRAVGDPPTLTVAPEAGWELLGPADRPVGAIATRRAPTGEGAVDGADEVDDELVLSALAAAATQALVRIDLVDQLRAQATTDALTGLANRRQLDDALTAALRSRVRHPRALTVLFLDLDGFKAVNDRAGHDAGDQLLRDVADRLTAGLRETELVARIGGDEFVILADDIASHADALALAQRVRATVARETPVGPIAASVGIVHLAPGAELPEPTTLLREADAAMYLAKRQPPDRRVHLTELDGGAATA